MDQAPALAEGPVNEEPTSGDVLFRYCSPEATVAGMVAIVAQGEISTARQGKGVVGFGQVEGGKVRITPISILAGHDSLKDPVRRQAPIDEQLRSGNAQGISRNTGQALDVVLGFDAGRKASLDAANTGRFENEDITASWIDEIIRHFVHKDLIARVDISASDRLTFFQY